MRVKRGCRFSLLVILAIAAVPSWAQSVIENPAKPKAANAGRVVVPEEVLAISDEGTSDFYFYWPRDPRIAPDGSLILSDKDQILHFGADGRFQRNFFKKGQGPGEVTYFGVCWPTDTNIIVQSVYPNKLIFFDHSGKYEREIRIGTLPGVRRPQAQLRLVRGEEYFLEAWDSPPFEKDEPEFVDMPRTILALNAATGDLKTLATFSTKAYVQASPGGGGGAHYPVTNLIAVPFKEQYLALTHTEEYLLKIYDPAANRVVREFRRAYERVKPEPLTEEQKKGGAMIGNKPFRPPEVKYQNDVKNLLTRGDEIWAVTSTQDKAKGVLIDVFDSEGVYRDCFWLALPEPARKSLLSPGQSALDGEFLWVVEKSEDETYAIKKYRVASSQARGTVPLRGQSHELRGDLEGQMNVPIHDGP
jgi:hypothetical protein